MSLSVHGKAAKDRAARGTYYSVSDYGDSDEKIVYDSEKHIQQLQHSLSSSSYKSISHNDHRHHKFYKPNANRTWVLTCFLVALASCVLLLELALHFHPDAKTIPELHPKNVSIEQRAVLWSRQDGMRTYGSHGALLDITAMEKEYGYLLSFKPPPKRQATSDSENSATTDSESADISEPTSIVSDSDSITTITSEESSPTAAETTYIPSFPAPDEQVTITSEQETTVGNPAPDNLITITSDRTPIADPAAQVTTTSDDNDNGVSGVPNPGEQVTITTASPVTSPVVSNELTITPGQPGPDEQVSIVNGGASETGAAAAIVTLDGIASVVSGSLIVSGGAVIGTAPQTAPASVVSGSLIVSGGAILATVQQGASQGAATGAAAVGSVTLTNSLGVPTATVAYTGDLVATDANGQETTISYNGDVVLTDSNGKPTNTLSYADNVVLTDANGNPTKTVLYSAAATSTTAAKSQNSSADDASFTQWSYFWAMYVPNIVGVILQSSWLVVFATFKMMEPFYQLASPGGASAGSTLTADYLSTGLTASIFTVAAEGHWVMVLAGQIQFGLALIMLFVSEAMNVVPTAYCKTEITDQQPCDPKWVVNTQMIRVIEVLLVGCFSMVVMVIVLNRKRVSGVYSDPSSIATMADILKHKPLIYEIRDLSPVASKDEIAHDLADSRYMLGTFFDQGKEQYGIVKLDVHKDRSATFEKDTFIKSANRRIGTMSNNVAHGMNKTVPFLPDFLCMTVATILFTLVLVYYCIDGYSKNAFNLWMNSAKIGPSIVLTGLAVIMGFLVKRKERHFRLSHPYVVLGKGPALASDSITVGTENTPFTSVYTSFRSKDISLALLSLAAVFSDVILILVPGVPFTAAQTRPVYLSSTWIVLGLSLIIFIVVMRITFKEWKNGNRYYECPETLADVLMRLCASRFVEEKNVLEQTSHKDVFDGDDDYSQQRRYEGPHGIKTYTYGVMEGVDGIRRHMVEENVHASGLVHPAYRR